MELTKLQLAALYEFFTRTLKQAYVETAGMDPQADANFVEVEFMVHQLAREAGLVQEGGANDA